MEHALLAGHRVGEPEFAGMEGLAVEFCQQTPCALADFRAEPAQALFPAAISRVAEHVVAQVSEMHPDLVCPPCFQIYTKPGKESICCFGFIPG